MKERWQHQVVHIARKTNNAEVVFLLLRFFGVGGALAIPVLAGINFAGKASTGIKVATLVLSLIVAIATASEQVFRLGQRWRLYRETRESLEAEGWNFFERADVYAKKNREASFRLFFQRVEEQLRRFERQYLAEIAIIPSSRDTTSENEPEGNLRTR